MRTQRDRRPLDKHGTLQAPFIWPGFRSSSKFMASQLVNLERLIENILKIRYIKMRLYTRDIKIKLFNETCWKK